MQEIDITLITGYTLMTKIHSHCNGDAKEGRVSTTGAREGYCKRFRGRVFVRLSVHVAEWGGPLPGQVEPVRLRGTKGLVGWGGGKGSPREGLD